MYSTNINMPRYREDFIYTMKTLESISVSKTTYILSDRTKRIIKKLTNQVTCPNYRRKPDFRKRFQHNEIKSYNVVKHDTIEYVPQIRGLLNKITESNLISLTDEIMMKIELVTTYDVNNIVECIFNIASRNHFYSNQYAYVYNQISQKYTYIEQLFRKSIQKLIPNILECVDVDPNINYESFCEMNKINEKNRAFVHFIMNVFKINQSNYVKTILIDVVHSLCEKMSTVVYKENKKNTCHEIAEVLYIIIGHNDNIKLFDDTFISSLDLYIRDILNIDKNICKSYSNKMKFKMMDLLDILDKNKLKK